MSNSRTQAAKKAWATRRRPIYKATKTAKAGREALVSWCNSNGWKIMFFEGESGTSRSGIVDAIMGRIKSENPDAIEIRLVQLKSGTGGLTAREISRMKQAVEKVSMEWLLAAFDGRTIHFLPDIPSRSR